MVELIICAPTLKIANKYKRENYFRKKGVRTVAIDEATIRGYSCGNFIVLNYDDMNKKQQDTFNRTVPYLALYKSLNINYITYRDIAQSG